MRTRLFLYFTPAPSVFVTQSLQHIEQFRPCQPPDRDSDIPQLTSAAALIGDQCFGPSTQQSHDGVGRATKLQRLLVLIARTVPTDCREGTYGDREAYLNRTRPTRRRKTLPVLLTGGLPTPAIRHPTPSAFRAVPRPGVRFRWPPFALAPGWFAAPPTRAESIPGLLWVLMSSASAPIGPVSIGEILPGGRQSEMAVPGQPPGAVGCPALPRRDGVRTPSTSLRPRVGRGPEIPGRHRVRNGSVHLGRRRLIAHHPDNFRRRRFAALQSFTLIAQPSTAAGSVMSSCIPAPPDWPRRHPARSSELQRMTVATAEEQRLDDIEIAHPGWGRLSRWSSPCPCRRYRCGLPIR